MHAAKDVQFIVRLNWHNGNTVIRTFIIYLILHTRHVVIMPYMCLCYHTARYFHAIINVSRFFFICFGANSMYAIIVKVNKYQC